MTFNVISVIILDKIDEFSSSIDRGDSRRGEPSRSCYDPPSEPSSMAKPKRPTANPTRGARGRTGHTGRTGPRGPRGPAGKNHAGEIAALTAHVDRLVSGLRTHASQTVTLTAQVTDLVKELQIQLTRIGQIQAQLDRITGVPIVRRDRRITNRTEH